MVQYGQTYIIAKIASLPFIDIVGKDIIKSANVFRVLQLNLQDMRDIFEQKEKRRKKAMYLNWLRPAWRYFAVENNTMSLNGYHLVMTIFLVTSSNLEDPTTSIGTNINSIMVV